MNNAKETVLLVMNQALGNAQDNYARASKSFFGLTPGQMSDQHGQSGFTRAEILNGYKKTVTEIKEAIEWVVSKR